jgi:hypothetical protein
MHGFYVGISPLDARFESLASLGQMSPKTKCYDVTMLTYQKNDISKFGVWECDNDIKIYVRFNIFFCAYTLNIYASITYVLIIITKTW